MSLPTPTNRIETYLAYLCGENIALPEEPLNNIEKYLAKICEESVELPSEPLNDIETLLAIKCDETHEIAPYMPLNRIEAYLLKWIGESEELPEGTPLNNIEAYLEHLCNEQPQVVIKIITGLFPLSMQDSSEANAVSLKVMGKTKKAIVIDGERYTYPATINLHNYVTFNGTTYVKTPISAYTNKGKFDIKFSKADGNTRFITGQNPSTTSNHVGIWTSSNLMIQNGANTRTTIVNIGSTQHTLLVEDGKITFDGTETQMVSVAEFAVNQDLYIGGATDPTTGEVDPRCYNGDLAHYFHKNSNGNYDLLVMGATQNGVVGLYDFISQTFLAPEVGTLTAGTNATVELVGVGDKTENLFDPSNIKYNGSSISSSNGSKTSGANRCINVFGWLDAGDYIICSTNNTIGGYLHKYSEEGTDSSFSGWVGVVTLGSATRSGSLYCKTFTLTERCYCRGVNLESIENSGNIMLVKGNSAPTEYIPYGYKVPIDVNGAILNAYRPHEFYNCGDYADEIGIVSGNDVIRCGTYRFDGTENWGLNGGVAGLFQLALSGSKPQTTAPYNGHCVGFTETQKAAGSLADGECTFQGQSGTNGRISIKCLAYENDLAGFKAMLSTLNANGTPVTAIVQKATESSETADPLTIPLAYGTNHIDCETEVEPSSGTLEYYGRGLTVVGGDVNA